MVSQWGNLSLTVYGSLSQHATIYCSYFDLVKLSCPFHTTHIYPYPFTSINDLNFDTLLFMLAMLGFVFRAPNECRGG